MAGQDPFREAAKVPVIGKWISRIGMVVNILGQPCSATPLIWVEAAWVNLPHLLFGFVKPFKLAMDYNIHTGRGNRWGLPHGGGKRGKRGRAPYGAIVEGLIEDASKVLGNEASWLLFELGDLALKAEWYFFIADLTTEFLLNWVSTAYMWGGCDNPFAPYAHGNAVLGFGYIPVPGGALYDGWQWDEVRGFATGPTGVAVEDGIEASVGFSLSTGPWPVAPQLPLATWRAKLLYSRGGDSGWITPMRNTSGGYTATFMRQAFTGDNSGGFYQVLLQINAEEGVWWCNGGHMTAAADKGNIHPDP
jgi:hypothetical protein